MKDELTPKQFIRVFIRSEKDLPKKGKYNVHYKQVGDDSLWLRDYDDEWKEHWLEHIDWYIIEQPDAAPTVDEQYLRDEFEQAMKRKNQDYAEGYVEGLQDGANDYMNHLTEHLTANQPKL